MILLWLDLILLLFIIASVSSATAAYHVKLISNQILGVKFDYDDDYIPFYLDYNSYNILIHNKESTSTSQLLENLIRQYSVTSVDNKEKRAATLNILGLLSLQYSVIPRESISQSENNNSINHQSQEYSLKACEESDYKIPEYVMNAMLMLTDLELQILILERGVQGCPNSFLLIEQLVLRYYRNNKLLEAFQILNTALRISPETYNLWILMINHSILAIKVRCLTLVHYLHPDMNTNIRKREHEHQSNHRNESIILSDCMVSMDTLLPIADLGYLLSLGLPIFPNEPSLLLLQGMIYDYQSQRLCAIEYYSSALQMISHANHSDIINLLGSGIIHENIKLLLHGQFPTEESNDYNSPPAFKKDSSENAVFSSYGQFNILNYTCFPLNILAQQILGKSSHPMSPPSPSAAHTTSNLSASNADIDTSTSINNPPASSVEIQLNLGCNEVHKCARRDWITIDLQSTALTHLTLSATDLHPFRNHSVARIYTSHMLEHMAFMAAGCEVCRALSEWRRVLQHGGVSVPDILVLSQLLVDPAVSYEDKMRAMAILYGGQRNHFDFHKTGFFEDFLRLQLTKYGFCDIRRVSWFKMFDDYSVWMLADKFISLNLEAVAC